MHLLHVIGGLGYRAHEHEASHDIQSRHHVEMHTGFTMYYWGTFVIVSGRFHGSSVRKDSYK